MSIFSDLLFTKRYAFNEAPDGLHQIGGQLPNEFHIPSNSFIGSMQYLGFISPKDKVFNWLPFDLHLVCPIYLNIEKVFLDYSIPSNPTVIYPTNTADITTEYDDILSDSVVIYQSIKVDTTLVGKLDEDEEDEIVGVAGKPLWVQQKDFPICPKSNKRMRFVCQLKSNGHVKTDFTNINAKERYYQQYFDEMNFWGDGDLFIFFEPTSKTACYFIQNT